MFYIKLYPRIHSSSIYLHFKIPDVLQNLTGKISKNDEDPSLIYSFMEKVKRKVKLSLQQAVKAGTVVRCRGSHIFYTSGH
jgi:hypothetical protein